MYHVHCVDLLLGKSTRVRLVSLDRLLQDPRVVSEAWSDLNLNGEGLPSNLGLYGGNESRLN